MKKYIIILLAFQAATIYGIKHPRKTPTNYVTQILNVTIYYCANNRNCGNRYKRSDVTTGNNVHSNHSGNERVPRRFKVDIHTPRQF